MSTDKSLTTWIFLNNFIKNGHLKFKKVGKDTIFKVNLKGCKE